MAVEYQYEQQLKRIRDKLGRFTSRIEQHPLEILLEEAPRIEAEAKLEVPVDTGRLRESIVAEVTQTRKTKAELTVSAHAYNNGYDYSNIQHENEMYLHPNGGKAHFIRDPFNRGVQRISDRLREEVKYDK